MISSILVAISTLGVAADQDFQPCYVTMNRWRTNHAETFRETMSIISDFGLQLPKAQILSLKAMGAREDYSVTDLNASPTGTVRFFDDKLRLQGAQFWVLPDEEAFLAYVAQQLTKDPGRTAHGTRRVRISGGDLPDSYVAYDETTGVMVASALTGTLRLDLTRLSEMLSHPSQCLYYVHADLTAVPDQLMTDFLATIRAESLAGLQQRDFESPSSYASRADSGRALHTLSQILISGAKSCEFAIRKTKAGGLAADFEFAAKPGSQLYVVLSNLHSPKRGVVVGRPADTIGFVELNASIPREIRSAVAGLTPALPDSDFREQLRKTLVRGYVAGAIGCFPWKDDVAAALAVATTAREVPATGLPKPYSILNGATRWRTPTPGGGSWEWSADIDQGVARLLLTPTASEPALLDSWITPRDRARPRQLLRFRFDAARLARASGTSEIFRTLERLFDEHQLSQLRARTRSQVENLRRQKGLKLQLNDLERIVDASGLPRQLPGQLVSMQERAKEESTSDFRCEGSITQADGSLRGNLRVGKDLYHLCRARALLFGARLSAK